MPPSPPADLASVVPVDVDEGLLRSLPLPPLGRGDDKDDRGRIVIVAGSTRTPGAALLAALAAMRVGAGKLQIATAEPVAQALAVAVPEALVEPLPATDDGNVSGAKAVDQLLELADGAQAMVLGPGLLGRREIADLVDGLADRLDEAVALVLDAGALGAAPESAATLRSRPAPVVVTPNPEELAALSAALVGGQGGGGENTRDADGGTGPAGPGPMAVAVALRLGAAVACGPWVTGPGQPLYRHDIGDVGLATSGSGDVLAGVVGGLCARGCDAITAALLATHLHGLAGRRLSRRTGRLGYLARELLDELAPALATVYEP